MRLHHRADAGPDADRARLCHHIEQTVATDPEAGWVFIADNLNMHVGELGEIRGGGLRDQGDLGEKEKRGVLESQASRASSCPTPAIGFDSCTRRSLVRG